MDEASSRWNRCRLEVEQVRKEEEVEQMARKRGVVEQVNPPSCRRHPRARRQGWRSSRGNLGSEGRGKKITHTHKTGKRREGRGGRNRVEREGGEGERGSVRVQDYEVVWMVE